MQARWTIEVLGGVRARRGAVIVARFRTQKTAALLARLAWLCGRPPHHVVAGGERREALVEMLWPGCAPEAGRNALSKAISSLRAQLEPPGTRRGTVIAATRETVAL